MNRIQPLFLLTVFLLLLPGCSGSDDYAQLDFEADNGGITLPDGYRAVVVADSLGRARHLAVDEDGDIYVALRSPVNGHGVAALRDEDGDGVADRREYFGSQAGSGLALYNGHLYLGTPTSVIRWSMEGGDLVPASEAQTVVSGLPEQRSHRDKSIAIDPEGNLYVNIGAPSNACQQESRTPGSPGMDPCPQLENQAGIWRFSADSLDQAPSDGSRYATGIRNAIALEWNTAAGGLYVAQHGRDQLHSLWPEHFNAEENAALPAEELFKVEEGDNFGWPYAYYDWQKQQKMLSPEYGGDGETPVEEGRFEDPILAFPGHWAPNDLLFYSGQTFPDSLREGAFIAFHGSWNRAPEPQAGYKVVFAPFEGAMPAGDYRTFAGGFAGTDTLRSPGQAEFRPMGLAQGPDGSLYITDSTRGRIWRVVYTGDAAE